MLPAPARTTWHLHALLIMRCAHKPLRSRHESRMRVNEPTVGDNIHTRHCLLNQSLKQSTSTDTDASDAETQFNKGGRTGVRPYAAPPATAISHFLACTRRVRDRYRSRKKGRAAELTSGGGWGPPAGPPAGATSQCIACTRTSSAPLSSSRSSRSSCRTLMRMGRPMLPTAIWACKPQRQGQGMRTLDKG